MNQEFNPHKISTRGNYYQLETQIHRSISTPLKKSKKKTFRTDQVQLNNKTRWVLRRPGAQLISQKRQRRNAGCALPHRYIKEQPKLENPSLSQDRGNDIPSSIRNNQRGLCNPMGWKRREKAASSFAVSVPGEIDRPFLPNIHCSASFFMFKATQTPKCIYSRANNEPRRRGGPKSNRAEGGDGLSDMSNPVVASSSTLLIDQKFWKPL